MGRRAWRTVATLNNISSCFRFGRKKTTIAHMVAAGIAVVAVSLIPHGTNNTGESPLQVEAGAYVLELSALTFLAGVLRPSILIMTIQILCIAILCNVSVDVT